MDEFDDNAYFTYLRGVRSHIERFVCDRRIYTVTDLRGVHILEELASLINTELERHGEQEERDE